MCGVLPVRRTFNLRGQADYTSAGRQIRKHGNLGAAADRHHAERWSISVAAATHCPPKLQAGLQTLLVNSCVCAAAAADSLLWASVAVRCSASSAVPHQADLRSAVMCCREAANGLLQGLAIEQPGRPVGPPGARGAVAGGGRASQTALASIQPAHRVVCHRSEEATGSQATNV